MDTTVVVPTFNEGGNVRELVRRLTEALEGRAAEVLFVDDSTDDTPDIIRQLAREQAGTALPVHLLHRGEHDRVGGLAGAVTAGVAWSSADHIVVMDGDLQHPPALVPLLRCGLDTADLVVASRYCGEGDASGLSTSWRRAISSSSTMLAKACFPVRVARVCTDPMTGFFAFRRDAVDLSLLRPRGFKILLEILTRHDLKVEEVPFVFGDRHDGQSKASWRNGLQFVYQMASLRMGRMSRFAAVGALGTLLNLLVMALLLHGPLHTHYLVASLLAAEASIVQNFVLQERFVFGDMRRGRLRWRFLTFLGFNNVEAAIRVPLLILLVDRAGLMPVPSQALLLALAFVLRFLFTSRVVYRPSRNRTAHGSDGLDVAARATA